MTESTDHQTELPAVSDEHRLRLADHMARRLFGHNLDADTPIGQAVLATVGIGLTLPLADAALACPGFTYTGDQP